jgi:ribosomal protein S18 acetylase RimI-like enzyme
MHVVMRLIQENEGARPVRIRRCIDRHLKRGVLYHRFLCRRGGGCESQQRRNYERESCWNHGVPMLVSSLDNVIERLEDLRGTEYLRSTNIECERTVRTSSPPITLRAARPEPEDGLAFAGYLDTSAEGFFRFWLGRGFSRVIAEAFKKPGHDLSYEHATFAVREEKIIGMTTCYTAEQHRISSLAPLLEAEGYPTFRAAIIAAVFAPIFRVLDTLEDGDFYLQAIAVDPDARGAGVGSVLMDRVEDKGRASGSRRLCLDVSGANAGARRLYERLGMDVVSESKIFYMPGVRLLRMAKAI